MNKNWQTPALVGSLAIGALLPRLHVLSFLVRYMMMAMLFLAFLNLKTENIRFRRSHFLLLLVSPLTAIVAYACLKPFNTDWAIAAFLVAMTPTATSAPVITGLLGGDPAYAVLMVLLSSLVQPLIISAVLPFLGDGRSVHGVMDLIIPLFTTLMIPFFAALALRKTIPSLNDRIKKYPMITFVLWIVALSIVSATASDFIFRYQAPLGNIIGLGLVSLGLCTLNFTLGRLIGGKEYPLEASQALGQKNTVFSIWVAMNFANPMVTLGPTFYILWHNLWNAGQIHLYNMRKTPNDGR
ncbi:MAG: hypothetical protein WCT14_09175 [Treponemataceae bacterium]